MSESKTCGNLTSPRWSRPVRRVATDLLSAKVIENIDPVQFFYSPSFPFRILQVIVEPPKQDLLRG
ncbi:hypothetical protein TMatcc_005867 [Talaromyces marneffei ATCC 18224]